MKQAIIVGFGLAGFHYALELQKHKKDFIIISNEE
jgi:anaerobic glycerol-3-phosphate dehydrogenase